MKPIETGVGQAGPLDALALRAAAGDVDPLDDVCPQRFALPAAPTVAAAAEGRRVELWAVRRAFERLSARHDCVIVEGAGGLLVPVAEQQCMADLARDLDLPLIVVARAALGTINHTLLTLEAAVARGLSVAGVVISHASGPLSPADAANLEALRRALDSALLGEIPPLAPGQPPLRTRSTSTPCSGAPSPRFWPVAVRRSDLRTLTREPASALLQAGTCHEAETPGGSAGVAPRRRSAGGRPSAGDGWVAPVPPVRPFSAQGRGRRHRSTAEGRSLRRGQR